MAEEQVPGLVTAPPPPPDTFNQSSAPPPPPPMLPGFSTSPPPMVSGLSTSPPPDNEAHAPSYDGLKAGLSVGAVVIILGGLALGCWWCRRRARRRRRRGRRGVTHAGVARNLFSSEHFDPEDGRRRPQGVAPSSPRRPPLPHLHRELPAWPSPPPPWDMERAYDAYPPLRTTSSPVRPSSSFGSSWGSDEEIHPPPPPIPWPSPGSSTHGQIRGDGEYLAGPSSSDEGHFSADGGLPSPWHWPSPSVLRPGPSTSRSTAVSPTISSPAPAYINAATSSTSPSSSPSDAWSSTEPRTTTTEPRTTVHRIPPPSTTCSSVASNSTTPPPSLETVPDDDENDILSSPAAPPSPAPSAGGSSPYCLSFLVDYLEFIAQ